MSHDYLEYPLERGFIANWLVAGPVALADDAPVSLPASPMHLEEFQAGATKVRWEYARALADHMLHLSDFGDGPVQAWLYVELICPAIQITTFTITTTAHTGLWINGESVNEGGPVTLKAGANSVLVACTQADAATFVFAMQCAGLNAFARVPCATEHTARFQALERLFSQASLDRTLFIADDNIGLHWSENLEHVQNQPAATQEHDLEIGATSPRNMATQKTSGTSVQTVEKIVLRVQKSDGRIYAETLGIPRPGESTNTVPALHLPSGPCQLVLMPRPEAYAEGRLRVRRIFHLHALTTRPGDTGKSYAKRLYEAVRQAMQGERGLLAELAAMTLGAWPHVHPDVVVQALTTLRTDSRRGLRDIVLLLGMAYRYGTHELFPATARETLNTWISTLADTLTPDSTSSDEVIQLLTWTSVLLAKQYATHHTESTLAIAAEWLAQRGQYGVTTCFDDGDALDTLVFALSHIADLAEDILVRELAAVLLDKVLFTLALHHYQGIGPGGVLGTTAAIGRVVWGQGALNTRLWGLVGLANARAYPVPPIIADIARDIKTSSELRMTNAESGIAHRKSRTTYHTPDYMLTSTQSDAVASWIAVMGPEAVVYTNHPAHCGTHPVEYPNFWHGNGIPPRIAQWRDAIIARYNLPDSAWLDFTHAYFPTYAFDEHTTIDNWAFVRKGDAYLALGLAIHESKITNRELRVANDELRVSGRHTTWLCQLGRAADDGDFATFQARVLAGHVAVDEDSVIWTTLRGDTLCFGANEPLLVNGEAQPLTSTHHYETPYCTVGFPAKMMDIRFDDYLLRLDFTLDQ